MPTAPTMRLYLEDDHRLDAGARVVAVQDRSIAFDRTCFYPGGGDQPPDTGRVEIDGADVIEIAFVHADSDGAMMGKCTTPHSHRQG